MHTMSLLNNKEIQHNSNVELEKHVKIRWNLKEHILVVFELLLKVSSVSTEILSVFVTSDIPRFFQLFLCLDCFSYFSSQDLF